MSTDEAPCAVVAVFQPRLAAGGGFFWALQFNITFLGRGPLLALARGAWDERKRGVRASPLSGQMAVGGCCAPLSHLAVIRGSRSVSCNTSLVDDLLVTGIEGVQAILEIVFQLGKQGDGPA